MAFEKRNSSAVAQEPPVNQCARIEGAVHARFVCPSAVCRSQKCAPSATRFLPQERTIPYLERARILRTVDFRASSDCCPFMTRRFQVAPGSIEFDSYRVISTRAMGCMNLQN